MVVPEGVLAKSLLNHVSETQPPPSRAWGVLAPLLALFQVHLQSLRETLMQIRNDPRCLGKKKMAKVGMAQFMSF